MKTGILLISLGIAWILFHIFISYYSKICTPSMILCGFFPGITLILRGKEKFEIRN